MKKLYLDSCVYNRPFDDQKQERIALETSIFIYILEKVEEGEYKIVLSDALIFEHMKNPYPHRMKRIESYFSLAKEYIEINDSVIKRARKLRDMGILDLDALHIALAERAKVDYFITCDDGIIKLYKRTPNMTKLKIVSLTEFIGLEVK